MKKKEGLRYNQGKPRIDLVPADAMFHVGKVLAIGAEKYDERYYKVGKRFKTKKDTNGFYG